MRRWSEPSEMATIFAFLVAQPMKTGRRSSADCGPSGRAPAREHRMSRAAYRRTCGQGIARLVGRTAQYGQRLLCSLATRNERLGEALAPATHLANFGVLATRLARQRLRSEVIRACWSTLYTARLACSSETRNASELMAVAAQVCTQRTDETALLVGTTTILLLCYNTRM